MDLCDEEPESKKAKMLAGLILDIESEIAGKITTLAAIFQECHKINCVLTKKSFYLLTTHTFAITTQKFLQLCACDYILDTCGQILALSYA